MNAVWLPGAYVDASGMARAAPATIGNEYGPGDHAQGRATLFAQDTCLQFVTNQEHEYGQSHVGQSVQQELDVGRQDCLGTHSTEQQWACEQTDTDLTDDGGLANSLRQGTEGAGGCEEEGKGKEEVGDAVSSHAESPRVGAHRTQVCGHADEHGPTRGSESVFEKGQEMRSWPVQARWRTESCPRARRRAIWPIAAQRTMASDTAGSRS